MSWEEILKKEPRRRKKARKKRKKGKKKGGGQCTRRTGKTSSSRASKKYMACVPNGKGGYKRVHWGDPNAKVTGKSGNTGRKRNFRARHNCKSCKRGDYSARCMACRDW